MECITEIFTPATTDIKTLKDLEPTCTGAAVIFLTLPGEIYLLNFITPYLNFGRYLLSKGNRFRWWELCFVVVGFMIDDVCTAIGMQAEEIPRSIGEGNPTMSAAMQWLIQQDFAQTETAAMRIINIVFLIIIFGSHYMGWLSQNSRAYLLFTAAFKAWAGYKWCTLEPNKYTFADYLTFKDGRPTPERMSIPMVVAFSKARGYIGKARRRLTESSPGASWIESYLYKIFPMI